MPGASGPSDAAARTLYYWGTVERAAAEHWTTQRLWEAIHAQAAAAGPNAPVPTVQDVSRLRASAGAALRAADQLAAAPPTDAFASDYFAVAPFARPLAERNSMPVLQARLPYTVMTDAGDVEERFLSVMYRGALPVTVGQVMDDMWAAAAGAAKDYDVELLDVGDPSFLEL